MSVYNLATDEKKHYLQFIGCNTIDNSDGFYQILLNIANKSEWNAEDLSTINMMMKDGMGYFLQSIFRDKFQHPLYAKYYADKIFYRPSIGMKELYSISDKLKKGQITKEALVTECGGKITSLEEFSEQDWERKQRLQEEKAEICGDIAAKTKVKNSYLTYKSNY